MKIAVSNLAWDSDEEQHVAQLMQSLGIEGLEIAPTKVWESPLSTLSPERKQVRDRWNDRGIAIVSLQAVLFGRDDLRLFESAGSRAAMLDYLRGMIELAYDLGATRIVFGSPRNRARGVMSRTDANAIAVPFLRRIGDFAVESGVVFCVEPNPAQYGCDWITTVEEGHGLMLEVDHKGIALNADSGGITLAREDPSVVIPGSAANIAHFHISEPELAPIGTGGVAHPAFAGELRAAGYEGWVSVEMRPPPREPRLEVLSRSFGTAVDLYGDSRDKVG
jgi:D-psicose/D-tagatose/L-ribulose 3-epimerase